MTTKANNRPDREVQKRVPVFEARRDAITVTNKDPNFVYRIVNDVHDRISMFQRGGWEVVDSTESTFEAGEASTLGSVQTRAVGGGVNGVLMKIPKEWYEEDQKRKQSAIDEEESHISRTGKFSESGGYGEVKISRK